MYRIKESTVEPAHKWTDARGKASVSLEQKLGTGQLDFGEAEEFKNSTCTLLR